MNTSSAIYCDNTAARSWGSRSKKTKRAKHMDAKNHFINYVAENGEASGHHVNSEKTETDGFTKPADIKTLKKFCKVECVCPLK